MKLIYNVEDKPKFGQIIVFALQQLLAILAATIAVPAIIGNGMSQSAALFGAGVGTIVYLLFTKFKSPVFLGSSFAFRRLHTYREFHRFRQLQKQRNRGFPV